MRKFHEWLQLRESDNWYDFMNKRGGVPHGYVGSPGRDGETNYSYGREKEQIPHIEDESDLMIHVDRILHSQRVSVKDVGSFMQNVAESAPNPLSKTGRGPAEYRDHDFAGNTVISLINTWSREGMEIGEVVPSQAISLLNDMFSVTTQRLGTLEREGDERFSSAISFFRAAMKALRLVAKRLGENQNWKARASSMRQDRRKLERNPPEREYNYIGDI